MVKKKSSASVRERKASVEERIPRDACVRAAAAARAGPTGTNKGGAFWWGGAWAPIRGGGKAAGTGG